MKKKIDKYKFQCKVACVRCEKAIDWYSSEKGSNNPIYVSVCAKCKKQVAKVLKRLKRATFWVDAQERG